MDAELQQENDKAIAEALKRTASLREELATWESSLKRSKELKAEAAGGSEKVDSKTVNSEQ